MERIPHQTSSILDSRSVNRVGRISSRGRSLSWSRKTGSNVRNRISRSLSRSRPRWIGSGTTSLRSSASSWNPGIGALPGMVTGAAAPVSESIEWAGLTAMAKLLADSARSRLATVPHATLEISDRHNARHILGHGNLECEKHHSARTAQWNWNPRWGTATTPAGRQTNQQTGR